VNRETTPHPPALARHLDQVSSGMTSARLPDTVVAELRKSYSFEAAHHLPRVPAGHKCSRMHGHSYRVEIALRGPVNPETGWLVDFAVIDEAWAELFSRFDHRTLNDLGGLENPTCENLCAYIFAVLGNRVPHLLRVTVWETADSCCVFGGTSGGGDGDGA